MGRATCRPPLAPTRGTRAPSASAWGRRAPERRRPSWRATRRGTHARPPLGALGLGPAAACWPLSCRLRAAGAQAPQSQPPHARGAAPAGGRLSGTASQVAARGRVCRLRAMATRGSVARVSGPRGEHRPPLQPDARALQPQGAALGHTCRLLWPGRPSHGATAGPSAGAACAQAARGSVGKALPWCSAACVLIAIGKCSFNLRVRVRVYEEFWGFLMRSENLQSSSSICLLMHPIS